jgi:glycosyltransferase involved in cell wall biosynthesis
LAESRNILFNNVKTPYLTFIDSDDYYEKKALINLCKSSDEGSADITIGKI